MQLRRTLRPHHHAMPTLSDFRRKILALLLTDGDSKFRSVLQQISTRRDPSPSLFRQNDRSEAEVEEQREDVGESEGDGAGGDFGIELEGVKQRWNAEANDAGHTQR